MSTLKDFINNFDTSQPDWSKLPDDFPDCDLAGLSLDEVGKFNAIKVTWELSQPAKPKQRSRVWTNPEGYKYLVQWSNAVLLRFLVRALTDSLPKSEYRRKSQLDDAGRSVVRNIEEGYKRATTSEYSDFVGYSQGSLEEVKGDIKDLAQDGFLPSKSGSSLADLGIDLGACHRALKAGPEGEQAPYGADKGKYRKVEEVKGELEESKGMGPSAAGQAGAEAGSRRQATGQPGPWDYRPLAVLYPPLAKVRAEDLTYEIFIELINKTDFLLRRLVESLERKLSKNQKHYQVEQARIRDKFKKHKGW